eukprot:scaffold578_cov167-Amphora_coffeaeformis.AAC.57
MITNLKRIIRARPSYRKPESDTDSVSTGPPNDVEEKTEPSKSRSIEKKTLRSREVFPVVAPVQDLPPAECSEFDELNISFPNIYGYESQHDSEEKLKSGNKKTPLVQQGSEEGTVRRSRRHSLDSAGVGIMKITRSASGDGKDEHGTLSALQFCIPQIDPLESKIEKSDTKSRSFLSRSLQRSDKICASFRGRRHSMSYTPSQSSQEPSGKDIKAGDASDEAITRPRPTLKRENSSFADATFRQSLPMSYRVNKTVDPAPEEKEEIRPTLQREGSSFYTGSSFRVRARRLSLECSGYSGDRSSHGSGDVPRINRRSSLGGLSGSVDTVAPTPATESTTPSGPIRGSSFRGRRTPRRVASADLLEYGHKNGMTAITSSSIMSGEAENLSGSSSHSQSVRNSSFRRSTPRRAKSADLLEYGSSQGVAAIASSSIMTRDTGNLSGSSSHSQSVRNSSFRRSCPRRAASADLVEYGSGNGVAAIASSNIVRRKPENLAGSSSQSQTSLARSTSFRRQSLCGSSSHSQTSLARSTSFRRQSLSGSSNLSQTSFARSTSFRGRRIPCRASSGPVSGSMVNAFNAAASPPTSSDKLLGECDDSSSHDSFGCE